MRVSTSDQANGLDAQRHAISTWAVARGVRVLAWCVDAGVGGATPAADRDGLMDALAALREHTAGLLVAAKRDRFARDVSTAATLERLAAEAGARVVTADGLDASDTPEGQLIRTIIDAMAAYERALIRARTRAALAAKKARGEIVGRPPIGWRVHGTGLVQDPLEQSALRTMRRLRDEGKTLDEIARSLTGKYECRGKRWHAATVMRALERGTRL